jgi:hypothetical protein
MLHGNSAFRFYLKKKKNKDRMKERKKDRKQEK